MLKWIIEILKRIFMNPETTDRTTENTNVDEKKVLSKDRIATTETSGAYWLSFDATETVKYQNTDANTYCIDGYYSQTNIAGDPTLEVYPLNTMILRLDTYNLFEQGLATMSSAVDPNGNHLYFTYRWQYQAAANTFRVYVNRVLYATKVTEAQIW